MKKKKSSYKEIRRENFIEDNKREDALIKKLSKKLGASRKKVKKTSENHPSWVRESGFDYLLDFERHHLVNGNLKNEKRDLGVKRSKIDFENNIYGNTADTVEDNLQNNDQFEKAGVRRHSVKPHPTVNNVENISEQPVSDEKENSSILELRRTIRKSLNCVSESQMPRTISDLISLFTDKPRAVVRNVLIDEIDGLLGSFPLGRGQSVGWLQQELAACFVSVQGSLDQSGQASNLVAYMAERLVKNLQNLSNYSVSDKSLDSGILASRGVFIAYLYRFSTLTGDLVLDLIEEFVASKHLFALQAAHQMVKPISILLTKELLPRCQSLINNLKENLSSLESSDFEKSSELEGILQCLSGKRTREPALASAEHFTKMMQKWNKGVSFQKEARLLLRLEDLRNIGSKGRWWAVGSAVPPTIDLLDQPISNKKIPHEILSKELTDTADRLGLITPIRRQMFAILMSTSGGPDSTADALVRACGAEKKSSTVSEHREREVIQIIMTCLMSEQPFNRFYPRVLGGLLNTHRRFGMMIRCAFWDIMAKDELTLEAKTNSGRAIGMLASVFDFPLLVLKKFNFGDVSPANIGLLSSVVQELASSSFNKTIEKFARLSGANPKLGRNLRIFMRRMSKSCDEESFRAFLSRLVSDLRDLFP